MLESILGNPTIEKVLLHLSVCKSAYPRLLSLFFDIFRANLRNPQV